MSDRLATVVLVAPTAPAIASGASRVTEITICALLCEGAFAGFTTLTTMGKGVSAQEKKDRMLAMFQNASAPFTKKEVDKHASKLFPSGAVEGVLKELCCDDLVREAKIGGTIFFWSFPGEAGSRKRAQVASAEAEAAKRAERLSTLSTQVDEARKASGMSEGDAARVRDAEAGIASFKKREADAGTEMDRLKMSGAQNMTLRKKDLPTMRDAANRWTDNCFELRKFMVESMNVEPNVADGMLNTDSIDYIE